jgi:Predicted transcriptional regulators
MTVYERIKEISKARGMSLQSVAKSAGLSQNMIYQYKTVNPKTETLRTLANVLGVSVDYLLGNTDEIHNTSTKEDKKTADLKEIMKEFEVVQFDGKTIPAEDLPVIERIIKGLLDD